MAMLRGIPKNLSLLQTGKNVFEVVINHTFKTRYRTPNFSGRGCFKSSFKHLRLARFLETCRGRGQVSLTGQSVCHSLSAPLRMPWSHIAFASLTVQA